MRPTLTLTLTIALSAATLCACQTPTIRRWAKVTDLPASAAPYVWVTSAPANPPDDLSAKNLPDHAGAAYVTALAAKAKTSKELRGNIAKPIKAPPDDVEDSTTVARVLLATVERPTIRPGDRLLMTRIVIRPADTKVTFTNYQYAATDRATISVGTVSISDTYGATAGISAGPASAATTSPSLSLTGSRTLGASRNVNQETIFAVSAEPDHLEIFRTGAEDRDLLGNSLIKVSIKYGTLTDAPNYWVPDISFTDEATGAPLPPDKARVDNLMPLALYPPHDLWVCVRMDYEDRQVDDPRSQDEGRQKVTIASGTVPEFAQKIVPYQDLQQLLWKIRNRRGGAIAFSDGLVVRELAFDDYNDAVEFAGWLKLKHPSVISNGALGFNIGASLTPIKNWDGLDVQLVEESVGSPGDPPTACKPPSSVPAGS